jgi:Helix-turn-helix domain
MPDANKDSGDEKLADLFDEFGGRLVSPGGAAALLGLSRQTIYTLCKRRELRSYRSDDLANRDTPRWVYIPLDDIYAYGEKVGRPVRRS